MKSKNVKFSKSLDNLTDNQLEFLKNINGGIQGTGPIIIYYPTRQPPKCQYGIWNPITRKCEEGSVD